MHFERLKPCPPNMRPRTQTDNSNRAQEDDSQSEVTAGEEATLAPSRTVLQLVDDQDEAVPGPNNAPIALNNDPSSQQPNEVGCRYPQRENHQRPLRYRDD